MNYRRVSWGFKCRRQFLELHTSTTHDWWLQKSMALNHGTLKAKQAVWCNFARWRYKAILWQTKTRNKHVHKQTHIQIHRQTSERTDGDITNRATKTHKENEQHHQKKILNLTITEQYYHWPHLISSESCSVHNVQSQSEKVSFHRSSVKIVACLLQSQSSNAKFKNICSITKYKILSLTKTGQSLNTKIRYESHIKS